VRSIDTLVVDGGQGGLASGFHLARRGVDHVVLEAGRIGESWRSRSWDSFTLVTPNWMIALPDLPAGVGGTGDPHGFLLEFMGLRFQTSAKSDLLFGVAAEAGRVVDRLLEAGREVVR
jgi:cation diffusion facilitator CzcD-associated flavoprotein CzcO